VGFCLEINVVPVSSLLFGDVIVNIKLFFRWPKQGLSERGGGQRRRENVYHISVPKGVFDSLNLLLRSNKDRLLLIEWIDFCALLYEEVEVLQKASGCEKCEMEERRIEAERTNER